MKKIYISGPISGRSLEEAKDEFSRYAKKIGSMGMNPVNPFYNNVKDDAPWETHMKADLKIMLDCDEVHMLPGWEKSKGAKIELRVAKDMGMTIVHVPSTDSKVQICFHSEMIEYTANGIDEAIDYLKNQMW